MSKTQIAWLHKYTLDNRWDIICRAIEVGLQELLDKQIECKHHLVNSIDDDRDVLIFEIKDE